MDFVRALITGTVDTPYSRGCFVFDIYFPSSYPTDPPLVKIITTGNGTVRYDTVIYSYLIAPNDSYFAPYKIIRIPESGKFLLVECGILGFGIRNTAQGIRNPTND